MTATGVWPTAGRACVSAPLPLRGRPPLQGGHYILPLAKLAKGESRRRRQLEIGHFDGSACPPRRRLLQIQIFLCEHLFASKCDFGATCLMAAPYQACIRSADLLTAA